MVGHDEGEASVHAGVPYEVSVLHTVGANQLPLTICYLTCTCKPVSLTQSVIMLTSCAPHPSAEVDIVGTLWDVVGICAVILQQTEDVLRGLQAHCALKGKIFQSLVAKTHRNQSNVC